MNDTTIVRDIIIREVKRMVTNAGVTSKIEIMPPNPIRPDWTAHVGVKYDFYTAGNPTLILRCSHNLQKRPRDILFIEFMNSYAKVMHVKRRGNATTAAEALMNHDYAYTRDIKVMYDTADALMTLKDYIYDTLTEFLKD